jgi:hypothetical protein
MRHIKDCSRKDLAILGHIREILDEARNKVYVGCERFAAGVSLQCGPMRPGGLFYTWDTWGMPLLAAGAGIGR